MTCSELIANFRDPGVIALVGLIGAFLGVIGRSFMFTKAEARAEKQRLHDNSDRYRKTREARYLAFTEALSAYTKRSGPATMDELLSLATAGDLYFNELRVVADAILSQNLDAHSRDNTFVPDILRALQKTIPQYYNVLSEMAKKLGAPYAGKFNRGDYASLIAVVEKYAPSALMPTFDWEGNYKK